MSYQLKLNPKQLEMLGFEHCGTFGPGGPQDTYYEIKAGAGFLRHYLTPAWQFHLPLSGESTLYTGLDISSIPYLITALQIFCVDFSRFSIIELENA